MKEENKIKVIGLTGIFMGIVAFFMYCFMVSCCTPTKLNETFSTKDFHEAKFVLAKVVFIDSIQRFDVTHQYYHRVCRIYWEDTEKIKWLTYADSPCPVNIGYSMPLLTKR